MDLSASLPDELNVFYARFEDSNTLPAVKLPADNNSCSLTFSLPNVSRSLKAVNPRKAPGPDGVHGRVLRSCANQLAEVLTDIFNLSLRLSVIPTCFKKTTIVPVPKKSVVTCLNDYRPVALTSIVMKCFERLIKDHICSFLPDTMDPLQFAYRKNRSTDDTIALTVHNALTHMDKKNTYVRMLFIDYSSAMKILIIFILYIISGPVDCSDVIGYSGGSVIITSNIKCSAKVLSVNISDVREADEVSYLFGVWNGAGSVRYYSYFTEMYLHVTGLSTTIQPVKATFMMTSAALKEIPSAVYFSSSVTIINIISVCVCVTLLLIGGFALIYKLRHKRTQGSASFSTVIHEERL
ncbi:hypothetical protein PGIGA_G00071660 [Pangasianodon gigas]|uniref:Uncharacterized protein n=1 Tax=Pangasianodon gigas TaxID=30993 RepID=A0ACC5X7Y1_PANGG|nr:hypothetical protein [Pangasianodon gigas]